MGRGIVCKIGVSKTLIEFFANNYNLQGKDSKPFEMFTTLVCIIVWFYMRRISAIYSMNKSWVQKFFDKPSGLGFRRIFRSHLRSGDFSMSYILDSYWKDHWNVDGLWKFLRVQLDVDMRILVETVKINQPKFAVWRR